MLLLLNHVFAKCHQKFCCWGFDGVSMSLLIEIMSNEFGRPCRGKLHKTLKRNYFVSSDIPHFGETVKISLYEPIKQLEIVVVLFCR